MKKSFTLIELLVVIAIIAILAGLVMPALGHAQAKGRTTECINNKRQVMTVLRMYANDHTSMVPYLLSTEGTNRVMRPYSWILGGLGNGTYGKELVSKKAMVCNTLNKKDLDLTNGTNAFGMVDVAFGGSGWYDAVARGEATKTNKNKYGRFVAKALEGTDGTGTSGRTVAYVLEKMKSPSEMILLADAFTVPTSEQEQGYWSFTPEDIAPSFNSAVASSEDSMKVNDQTPGTRTLIGVVHAGSTTVAYADGRAESLTGKQLETSVLNVSKFYDESFE